MKKPASKRRLAARCSHLQGTVPLIQRLRCRLLSPTLGKEILPTAVFTCSHKSAHKMPEIVDDKSEHCIPFILERLRLHKEQHEGRGQKPPPFFLGLNGVQGAGKTTLVGETRSQLLNFRILLSLSQQVIASS